MKTRLKRPCLGGKAIFGWVVRDNAGSCSLSRRTGRGDQSRPDAAQPISDQEAYIVFISPGMGRNFELRCIPECLTFGPSS